jgi:hypothetical protein
MSLLEADAVLDFAFEFGLSSPFPVALYLMWLSPALTCRVRVLRGSYRELPRMRGVKCRLQARTSLDSGQTVRAKSVRLHRAETSRFKPSPGK